jgi:hypothetical protein
MTVEYGVESDSEMFMFHGALMAEGRWILQSAYFACFANNDYL